MGVATESCPWTLEGLPGQQITLEIFDFTLSSEISRVTQGDGDIEFSQSVFILQYFILQWYPRWCRILTIEEFEKTEGIQDGRHFPGSNNKYIFDIIEADSWFWCLPYRFFSSMPDIVVRSKILRYIILCVMHIKMGYIDSQWMIIPVCLAYYIDPLTAWPWACNNVK